MDTVESEEEVESTVASFGTKPLSIPSAVRTSMAICWVARILRDLLKDEVQNVSQELRRGPQLSIRADRLASRSCRELLELIEEKLMSEENPSSTRHA
jgi:hypothetical protein